MPDFAACEIEVLTSEAVGGGFGMLTKGTAQMPDREKTSQPVDRLNEERTNAKEETSVESRR